MVATLKEVRMLLRIAHGEPHCGVPAVRRGHETRIQSRPKICDEIRQWISEILILPTAKSMLCHDDSATEECVSIIKGGYLGTFLNAKQRLDNRAPVGLKIERHLAPIDCSDPFGRAFGHGSGDCDRMPLHVPASRFSRARLRAIPQR